MGVVIGVLPIRSLSVAAIIIGATTGSLFAGLVSLAVWGILSMLNIANPVDPALMAGVVIGFFAAGYGGGRMTRPSATHGILAALLMAVIVGIVSIVSGSTPSPLTIVILVLLAATLGRLGGVAAGKR